MYMMKAAHDSLGHRGIYSTKNMLTSVSGGPELERDVVWYIKSCHYCQERQKTLVQIPPVENTYTVSISGGARGYNSYDNLNLMGVNTLYTRVAISHPGRKHARCRKKMQSPLAVGCSRTLSVVGAAWWRL